MEPKDMFDKLAAPFPAEDIEWRAGATNAEKTSGLALAYITARAVMERLDEVVGQANWKDEYRAGPDGGVVCKLSIRMPVPGHLDGEWVAKEDAAENTDYEEVKGGISSAFKRAGVKWGIGRYLYKLDSKWLPCVARGKIVVFTPTPTLPSWALPKRAVEEKEEEVSAPAEYTRTSKGLASYALATFGMDGHKVGQVLSTNNIHAFAPENWDIYTELLAKEDAAAKVRNGYAV